MFCRASDFIIIVTPRRGKVMILLERLTSSLHWYDLANTEIFLVLGLTNPPVWTFFAPSPNWERPIAWLYVMVTVSNGLPVRGQFSSTVHLSTEKMFMACSHCSLSHQAPRYSSKSGHLNHGLERPTKNWKTAVKALL